jgi:hypothetical protein
MISNSSKLYKTDLKFLTKLLREMIIQNLKIVIKKLYLICTGNKKSTDPSDLHLYLQTANQKNKSGLFIEN